MARPKAKEENLQVTTRLSISMIKELDDLAEVLCSTKTNIIKKCLRIGIDVLKNQNLGIREELRVLNERKFSKNK